MTPFLVRKGTRELRSDSSRLGRLMVQSSGLFLAAFYAVHLEHWVLIHLRSSSQRGIRPNEIPLPIGKQLPVALIACDRLFKEESAF